MKAFVLLLIFSILVVGCMNNTSVRKSNSSGDSTELLTYYNNKAYEDINEKTIDLYDTRDSLAFFNAILYLDSALMYCPDCNNILMRKIDFLLRLGRYDEALEDLDGYLKKNSDDLIALMGKGVVLEIQNNFSKAKKYYSEVYNDFESKMDTIDPNYVMSYFLLYGPENIDSLLSTKPIKDTLTIYVIQQAIANNNRKEIIESIFR
jgi:tetratricopeptide (TPR) repeat protein